MRSCGFPVNFASNRLLLAVYNLFVQHIACPHHAFLHFIALLDIACLFTIRNRSLGTDASEDDAGAIKVVPEDVTEAGQQQSEGKQLSILTLQIYFGE